MLPEDIPPNDSSNAMMIAKHAAIKASKFAAVPKSLQKSVAETKVEYRRLGKSGLRVSNPIFGGLQVGSSDWLPWVLGEDKVYLAPQGSSCTCCWYGGANC